MHFDETPPTYLLPLRWSRPADPAFATGAMETFLQTVDSLPDAFDLAFTIAAGGDSPTEAGFVVSGFSDEHAMEFAQRLSVVARATLPFFGFGEAEPTAPISRSAPCLTIERVDERGRSQIPVVGGAWHAAGQLRTRTRMTVAFPSLASGRIRSGDDLQCDIRLTGDVADVSIVASLLAADTAETARLVPRAHRGTSSWLPIGTVANLLVAPNRLHGVWPVVPPRDPADLVATFDDVVPPHGVVFGGSGQGKTTFLEHRIRAAVADDRTLLVMCPTGDLAARAAAILEETGRPFDAVDFGDRDEPARFNLCEPPSWVTPEEHVAAVVDAIEQAWLGELTTQMFGPVGRRSMRGAISVLVRDPAGPWPITLAPELLRGGQLPDFWRDALQRIGDRDLEILVTETAKAIAGDRDAHYAPWLQSKLEPLIGPARIRRVVDCDHGTVELGGLVEGRSLVVSVPSAVLGDVGSTVLMGVLLAQALHLVRSVEIEERPRLDVVLDEIHRVPPTLLRTSLAEDRKYGVRHLLATQSTTSLDPKLLGSVLANCGVIGTFRTGVADAATLDAKFPTVLASHLQRLARHELAVTTGDRDYVGATPTPTVDPTDLSPLRSAHRRTARSGTKHDRQAVV